LHAIPRKRVRKTGVYRSSGKDGTGKHYLGQQDCNASNLDRDAWRLDVLHSIAGDILRDLYRALEAKVSIR